MSTHFAPQGPRVREEQAMSEGSPHGAQAEEWLGVEVCKQRRVDRARGLIYVDNCNIISY